MKEIMEYLKVRYVDCYLNEKGQGMVEYALILVFVVGIAVILSSSDKGIQGGLEAAFKKVSDQLQK